MIKILVDSGCDLVADEAAELGVEFLPMQISFADGDYADGVDLSHREFYEKLIECAELPKTSQINEYNFAEAFDRLTANGDEVIAITISSKLSGTFDCAKAAAKKCGGKVFVVDSLNCSVGERVLFMYALRLVSEGVLSADEIVDRLNAKKKDIKLLAVLDTLKYLKKGGRISPLVAFTGEMFSIKPVVAVVGGEVKVVGKAMGSKKSNNLLVKLIDECGGVDFDYPYAAAYTGLDDTLLQKYLQDSEALWKGNTDYVPVYSIGSTIGTHAGPGAIAVAFFAKGK